MSSPQESWQFPGWENLRVRSFIRPLRRTSPAVLVLCNDGHYYIIHKPGATLEDTGVARYLLGPAIAMAVGLPTVYTSFIRVDDSFVDGQLAGGRPSMGLMQTGLYCAERFAGNVLDSGCAVPYVSPRRQAHIVNRLDLIGMYLLGVWSGGGMPNVMFSTSHVDGNIKAVFVSTSQLFANIEAPLAPVSLDLTLMRSSLYANLWTTHAVRAWFSTIQQRAPLALQCTFAMVAARWPSIDTSQMHALLLERLQALDQALLLYGC